MQARRSSSSRVYGAKYPVMSRISCVSPAANVSVKPSLFPTIAMFDVTKPSYAFNVDTIGCSEPPAHSVRYRITPLGITGALNKYALAVPVEAHWLLTMLTVRSPMNGGP